MDALRKSIGVLILIFIGIPILLGTIWAVGVTRSVVSTEFLSDLPREIIEKVPTMIDEVLEEVDREDLVDDPNSRAWVKAVVQAKTSPRELLAKIGFMDWLENELSASLRLMGEMLRGEKPIRQIVLDLRPLKQALRHEAIKEYLVELLKNLPTCNEEQLKDWEAAAMNPRDLEDLPACRPAEMDMETAAQAINFVREREIEDIPDEVNLFEHTRAFPRRMNIVHSIVSFTYILFLVPLFFIVIASLIGGTGKGGVFRWMGISAVIGGGLSYALSLLVSNAVPWAIGVAPETSYGITPFEELMIGKAGDIGVVVVDRILSGVNSVSGVVCLIGIVLFALSYLLGSESREQTKTPPPPQQSQPGPKPPSNEPVIEAQFIKEEKAVEHGESENGNELPPGERKSDIEPKSK